MNPGTTAFTVTPLGASSIASERTSASSPALAAAEAGNTVTSGRKHVRHEAGHRHHPRIAAAAQMQDRGAHQAEECALDRLHRRGHRRVGQRRQRCPVCEPGVADQHVEAAEPRHRCVYQCRRHAGFREVAQRHLGSRPGCARRRGHCLGGIRDCAVCAPGSRRPVLPERDRPRHRCRWPRRSPGSRIDAPCCSLCAARRDGCQGVAGELAIQGRQRTKPLPLRGRGQGAPAPRVRVIGPARKHVRHVSTSGT